MKNSIKMVLFFSALCFLNTTNFVHADDSINITLKIYSGNTVLFDGPETVTACAESPEVDAPITLNGKCAIEQIEPALSNTWKWSDFDGDGKKTDGFLDELGGSSSDPTNNFYWGWFSNLNYGATSLNSHILSGGEELLLTYNSYPLQISASKISATVGDTIIFTAEEKSTFNGDWSDMLWTPSPGATITLGAQSCITIADGTCSIVLDTAGSLNAIGSKTLYVPSTSLGIEISSLVYHSGGGGSTSDGGSVPLPKPIFNIPKAIQYLSSVQDSGGSFGGSDMYTDWASIALSAGGITSDLQSKILVYMSEHNTLSSLSTDNERRAMALLALGQNPYSFNGTDYIDSIIKTFDGIQFGDQTIINDDVFALIPLYSAGYTANDDVIKKDIAFIISKQGVDGSWEGSVDMTSATVQALKAFDSDIVVAKALASADTYLKQAEESNGSWGASVYTTSWAMQAMNALGVSWVKDGQTGIDYLATMQSFDGAAIAIDETLQNKIWATSYAISAALGKPWSAILKPISKPVLSPKPVLPIISSSIENKTEKSVVLAVNKKPVIQKKDTQPTPSIMEIEKMTTSTLVATAEKSGSQIPLPITIASIVLVGGFILFRFVKHPN